MTQIRNLTQKTQETQKKILKLFQRKRGFFGLLVVALQGLMGWLMAYICELAHKDKPADTTSKTKSQPEDGFFRFLSTEHQPSIRKENLCHLCNLCDNKLECVHATRCTQRCKHSRQHTDNHLNNELRKFFLVCFHHCKLFNC